MEKTASAFFYQDMKSLPIKALRRTPKQIRDEERKPLILRNYTLYEVSDRSRQEFARWLKEPEQPAQLQLKVAKSCNFNLLT